MFNLQLLESPYNRDEYLHAISTTLPFQEHIRPIHLHDKRVVSFVSLGEVKLKEGSILSVFEVVTLLKSSIAYNRVFLRNLITDRLVYLSGGLCVHVNGKGQRWQFSFVYLESRHINHSVSRRFTYHFGKGTQVHNASRQLQKISKDSTLNDIKSAFSVEPLKKEFFCNISTWYELATQSVNFPNDEHIHDHIPKGIIRMLARLLFIWLLKEEGLINSLFFDKASLQSIIKWELPSSYYKAVLQNLFFATLNCPVADRAFRGSKTAPHITSTNYGITNLYRYKDYFTIKRTKDIIMLFRSVPFVDVRVFACLDRHATIPEEAQYDANRKLRGERGMIRSDSFSDRRRNTLIVPNYLFYSEGDYNSGLIEIFQQYQFTTGESTASDVDVALDPESLCLALENLTYK